MTQNSTMRTGTVILAPVLALALAIPVFGQTQSPDASQGQSQPPASAPASTAAAPSATSQPLEMQSKEGFWGHMNPFARKKWVNRQVAPVKSRINELDEVTAKNSADIKDVDARAQAGIQQASNTANQADQKATDAGNRASQAQQMASSASGKTDQLNTTVSNLDQYKAITEAEIRFSPGATKLGPKAKSTLDQLATELNGQKGYIVEVQGYSPARGQAGLANSQAMADAVVRYLVAERQVPLYRIHKVGLGFVKPVDATEASTHKGSVVNVTLMQNSLATLNTPAPPAAGGSPTGATQ